MRYREIRVDELKAFTQKELSTYNDLTDNETSHLNHPVTKCSEGTYDLMILFGVFDDQNTLAGFCLIPKYSKNIMTSLYIGRAFRNKGFASWLLNELKIDSLNCLTDNLNALRLYESLGFKQVSQNAFSIRFERKL